MDDIFRRRRRNPYVLPGIVLALVVAGVLIWHYALPHSSSTLPDTPDLAASAAAQTTPDLPPPATPPAAAATAPTVAPVIPAPASVVPPVAPIVVPAPSPIVAAPASPATQTAALPATLPTSLPSFNPGTIMAEAQQLMSSGDLLAARAALNPVIISGALPADQQRRSSDCRHRSTTLWFSHLAVSPAIPGLTATWSSRATCSRKSAHRLV